MHQCMGATFIKNIYATIKSNAHFHFTKNLSLWQKKSPARQEILKCLFFSDGAGDEKSGVYTSSACNQRYSVNDFTPIKPTARNYD